MDQTLIGQPPIKNKHHVPSPPHEAPIKATRNNKHSDSGFLFVTLIDLLLLNLCLFGIMVYKISPDKVFVQPYFSSLLSLALVANGFWFLIITFSDIYRVFEGAKLPLKISDLFWGSLIYFGVVSLIYNEFFFPIFKFHFIIESFVLFLIFSSFSHYAFRYLYRNNVRLLTYAVVGGGDSNLNYLDKVLSSVYGNHTHCVGRFANEDIAGVEHLGSYNDVEDYIKRNNNIDKLLYIYSDLTKDTVQRIIQLCRNRFIDFEIVPHGVDFFEKGIQVEQLAHLPIFRRKKEPLCLKNNEILKRSFDVVFSLLIILFVFPWLFPIVMILIKLDSKGPIFFLQQRTGYWNKPFYCVKFRTMTVNESSDLKQATKGDTRITRIGTFLRRTNIDELPQFFNVLRGEMSVVGPRPHMVKHTEDYSMLIDQYMIRHEVKPGITGWAQISGWRGPTEEVQQMAKRVEYDVHYIENWSFWFDCKCIFFTVFNMIKGENNAF